MARDLMNYGGRRRPHTSDTKQCRDCGIDFSPRGGQSTRYCATCAKARARDRARGKEERRLKRRTRAVSRPKIPGWATSRRAGLERACAACGEEFEKPGDAAVDHIVPAAVVAELNKNVLGKLRKEFEGSELKVKGLTMKVSGGIYDAENPANLWSACRKCHGRKRRAEVKLERGDTMGYLAEVNRIGFPLDRAKKALALYGLLR